MAADTGLENLKTDCIAALRKGDEDAFEAAAASLQEFQPQDLAFKMETLGWLACLALKQNCRRSGFKALNLLACASWILSRATQRRRAYFCRACAMWLLWRRVRTIRSCLRRQ